MSDAATPNHDPRQPEPGVEPEGINTPTLVMWGFVSVVLVVCVMLAAAALFFNAQNAIERRVVLAPEYPDVERVVTDQRGLLADYKAPDAEGQPYRIPIELAKKKVLAELREEN